ISDILFPARQSNDVGGILKVTLKDADAVGERSAVAVCETFVVIGCADLIERAGDCNARWPEVYFFGCWRRRDIELRDAEPLRPHGIELLKLFGSEAFAFPTPPPEFSLS